MKEIKNSQAVFCAHQVSDQQKLECEHEEMRKAQERVKQDHAAADTEQDNR